MEDLESEEFMRHSELIRDLFKDWRGLAGELDFISSNYGCYPLKTNPVGENFARFFWKKNENKQEGN